MWGHKNLNRPESKPTHYKVDRRNAHLSQSGASKVNQDSWLNDIIYQVLIVSDWLRQAFLKCTWKSYNNEDVYLLIALHVNFITTNFEASHLW